MVGYASAEACIISTLYKVSQYCLHFAFSAFSSFESKLRMSLLRSLNMRKLNVPVIIMELRAEFSHTADSTLKLYAAFKLLITVKLILDALLLNFWMVIKFHLIIQHIWSSMTKNITLNYRCILFFLEILWRFFLQ